MSATLANALDLREIAPSQRHALIFGAFDALAPGQTFELVNDHDPRPLHEQFLMRSPGKFSWSYLEKGPAVWRVQIGRSAKPAGGTCCGGCCGG